MNIRGRHQWAARAPKRSPILIPAKQRFGLVIHHNGPNMNLPGSLSGDALIAAEARKVRAIQRYHQDTLRWSDAAYSWLVGQSGVCWTVRGLNWDQFANGNDVVGINDGTDRQWYTAMAMIGWDPETGVEEQPSAAMVDAITDLVALVRREGAGDRVLPHNSFKVKRCPGRALTAVANRLDRRPLPAPTPIPGDDLMLPLSDEWKLARDALAGTDPHPIIERIQLGLNALIDRNLVPGPGLTVDSTPGPKTRAAWHRFETATGGEPADNQPGRKTWRVFWSWIFDTPPDATLELRRDLARATAALSTIRTEADTAIASLP